MHSSLLECIPFMNHSESLEKGPSIFPVFSHIDSDDSMKCDCSVAESPSRDDISDLTLCIGAFEIW